MAELFAFFENYINRAVAYTNQDRKIRVTQLDREYLGEHFLFLSLIQKN